MIFIGVDKDFKYSKAYSFEDVETFKKWGGKNLVAKGLTGKGGLNWRGIKNNDIRFIIIKDEGVRLFTYENIDNIYGNTTTKRSIQEKVGED